MNILVTGAGGYIGSVLVPRLLQAGHNVIALDRFYFGVETLSNFELDERLRIVRMDVREVPMSLLEGVDAICDLAALSNDPSGEIDPSLTRQINFEARKRLAHLAKEAKVSRYILSSSCSVYGVAAGLAGLQEGAPTNPVSTYAKCNLLAEEAVLSLKGPGFTPVALRNGTVFGVSPRMRFDLVVNLMVLKATVEGRITVLGGGLQVRPLIHVADMADAFIAVLEAPADKISGCIFNNAYANFNIRAIALKVRQVLGFPVDIVVAPDDVDKRNYSVSAERLRQVVGFSPSRSVEHGISEIYQALLAGEVEEGLKSKTVAWYRFLLDARKIVDEISLDNRIL